MLKLIFDKDVNFFKNNSVCQRFNVYHHLFKEMCHLLNYPNIATFNIDARLQRR